MSTDSTVAETFNTFFANVNLDIEYLSIGDCSFDTVVDTISDIIEEFKNHTGILTIKDNEKIEGHFHFSAITESNINSLDKKCLLHLTISLRDCLSKMPTTFNNFPARLLVENNDIISPYITEV